MCGIAGIFNYGDGEPVDPMQVEMMTATLRHRGPDSGGLHVDGRVGLGMRRLKVIDLETGDQPMANEDGTVVTVFNGEIYNFAELRADLERRGHVFRTHSDTEVIVHQYEEDGPRCVERFRGMFAVAVWDGRRRELALMRDRFGIKPLFVAENGGRLAFASEIKALLRIPWVDRSWSAPALCSHLDIGFVVHPETVYRGIRKVSPGSLEVWRLGEPAGGGRVDQRRYWRPVAAPCTPAPPFDGARERVQDLLEESIRLRLRSDVPLGVFLSGGVDSSVVVALMSRMVDRPVSTFSIGFESDAASELPAARAVAAHLGTDHHEELVTSSQARDLAALLSRFDEPFGDSSAIPTFCVSRMARERVTVALTGDGGDEIFGGYRHYRLAPYYNAVYRVPDRPRKAAASLIARWLPASSVAGALTRKAGEPRRRGYATMLYGPRSRPLWAALGDPLRSFLASGSSDDPGPLAWDGTTTGAQIIDQQTYLPDDILTKVDRSSMAVSLEARVPLLDHVLAEYVNALPRAYKVGRREGKLLLREIGRPLLPDGCLDRRKQGFSVPLRRWLTGPLRDWARDTLLGAPAGVVDGAQAMGLLTDLETGRRDSSAQVWVLLTLVTWAAAGGQEIPW